MQHDKTFHQNVICLKKNFSQTHSPAPQISHLRNNKVLPESFIFQKT